MSRAEPNSPSARPENPLARAVLLAGAVLATGHAAAAPRAAGSRPNMLLIITDQQRWDMLSCAGNHYVRTPALDGLASRGICFKRACCANVACEQRYEFVLQLKRVEPKRQMLEISGTRPETGLPSRLSLLQRELPSASCLPCLPALSKAPEWSSAWSRPPTQSN